MRRRDRVYEWVRRHPLAVDAMLAALLYLVLALPVPFGSDGVAQHLVGVVVCVALAFRRTAPVASFGVVVACGLVQVAIAFPLSQFNILYMASLYAVAGYGPRWASRTGLGVGFAAAALAAYRYDPGSVDAALFTTVGLSAIVVAAWAMGDVRRVRQDYVSELVGRAEQAERERDQRARIAVSEERARIAREMHDVVAHNLSVIVIQADGGRYAADDDPEAAKKVLETISDTGRGALAEMRRLLGVLRAEDDAGEMGPQPGLVRVPELVTSVRDAGLPVELDVVGQPRSLPDGASLAVFRVVQEALTNTLKHGGPAASARVELAYADEHLTVTVDDDGRGAGTGMETEAGPGGHGLIGMRERAAMYGGHVTAGPRPGGGWRVAVAMPYG